MKTVMREEVLQEKIVMLSERTSRGDQLVEKWSKKKDIGENMQETYDANPAKIRGLAFMLENQENHLRQLTETQISNAFQTTPENVLRIVRLGYPNSIRGDVFLEWAMETARDSIYYLSPVYAGTNRDATAADVTHESSASRYPSEVEEELMSISTKNYTITTDVQPIRPYSITILFDGVPVAADDGSGNITSSGGYLNTGATNSVNYTTGAIDINGASANAAASAVTVIYHVDTEVAASYTEIGSVELQLRDHQFRAKPYPLGVSWSKMTELLLGTTLKIDAEDALIRGASDEVKKALDFMALKTGYRSAQGNTLIEFDASIATTGADDELAHVNMFTNAIDRASDAMYNSLQRGGVTKIYGGPGFISYLKLHKKFTEAGKQPAVGAFKVGSLDGVDLYKCPSAIVPNNEGVAVYRNEQVPEDVSIAFGSLIPLYKTQTLEFKDFYSTTGLAHFGDSRVLQSKYLQPMKILNLPS